MVKSHEGDLTKGLGETAGEGIAMEAERTKILDAIERVRAFARSGATHISVVLLELNAVQVGDFKDDLAVLGDALEHLMIEKEKGEEEEEEEEEDEQGDDDFEDGGEEGDGGR